MKHFKSLLTIATILSLVIFISCGGSKKKDPVPEGKLAADQLSFGTWAPSEVTLGSSPRTEWDSFTLSFTANAGFTGGNYSTTNVPTDQGASDVWKASGSWAFATNTDGSLNLSRIVKDGDETNLVSVTVDVNEETQTGSLTLGFTVPEPSGRVEGFDGEWTFKFELQQ